MCCLYGVAAVPGNAGVFSGTMLGEMAIAAESWGSDSSGIAVMSNDNEADVTKRALSGSEFVRLGLMERALDRCGIGRVRSVIGHARHITRGSLAEVDCHPVRAGSVVCTHNGTIYNAGRLFRERMYRRAGKVDSEILARMAEDSLWREGISVGRLASLAQWCRGSLSAVLATARAPGKIVLLKGNMPLQVVYGRYALAWASRTSVLDPVMDRFPTWSTVEVPPMRAIEITAVASGRMKVTDYRDMRISRMRGI